MNNFSRREFLNLVGAGAAVISFPSMAKGNEMSHRQRIEAALAKQETDRLPFGFWWHFPNQDRSPRRLAELALELQRRMDMDFIKFSPYGLYSVVDWGTILDVRGGDLPPVAAEYGIKKPDDWYNLKVFDPNEGEYAVLLEAQRIAIKQRSDDTPLVQTVFNPLTSAAKLAGTETLLQHMREYPDALHAGLEVITETTRRFAIEVIRQGADGMFFASQWTSADKLTVEQYRAFAKQYDFEVLNATKDKAWFTMLHMHSNAQWDELLDYPVQAFNFPNYGEHSLSIDEARAKTDKVLITGLPSGLRGSGILMDGTPDEVDRLVSAAWNSGKRRGVILAPDEVVNIRSKPENLVALVNAVTATAG